MGILNRPQMDSVLLKESTQGNLTFFHAAWLGPNCEHGIVYILLVFLLYPKKIVCKQTVQKHHQVIIRCFKGDFSRNGDRSLRALIYYAGSLVLDKGSLHCLLLVYFLCIVDV